MNFVHVQCPFLRVPGILCRLLPEMPRKLWRKVLRTSRAVGAGSLPFWTQTVPIAPIAAVTPSVLVQERCHGTMASNGKMRKFPVTRARQLTKRLMLGLRPAFEKQMRKQQLPTHL